MTTLDNKLREIRAEIEAIMKNYSGMDFCGDPKCINYQACLEATNQILDLMIEIIGEDEAIKKSITMTQIHNICERNTLRAELRSLIKGDK